jgi:hypothetical protein
MRLAIPITTSELCRLAKVSRAGFYRWKAQAPSADPDMKLSPQRRRPVVGDPDLRDDIQRIALEFSYYGSRRITRELHERDWQVNRKKVQRLMREDASHLDFRNVRARHIHPARQDTLRQATLFPDFTDSHAQILNGI